MTIRNLVPFLLVLFGTSSCIPGLGPVPGHQTRRAELLFVKVLSSDPTNCFASDFVVAYLIWFEEATRVLTFEQSESQSLVGQIGPNGSSSLRGSGEHNGNAYMEEMNILVREGTEIDGTYRIEDETCPTPGMWTVSGRLDRALDTSKSDGGAGP